MEGKRISKVTARVDKDPNSVEKHRENRVNGGGGRMKSVPDSGHIPPPAPPHPTHYCLRTTTLTARRDNGPVKSPLPFPPVPESLRIDPILPNRRMFCCKGPLQIAESAKVRQVESLGKGGRRLENDQSAKQQPLLRPRVIGVSDDPPIVIRS